MARPLRIEYEGAWYHVMNRGAACQTIFNNDSQRELFLDLLQEIQSRYGIEVHAYCLMDNHYHLLLRTPRANLGRSMRHLDGVYTQRYNKSMQKDGPLFRGRYKACLIDSDEYLLEVSRYVHLNPVRAHLVKKPESYLWSSYASYIGYVESSIDFFPQETLNAFGGNRELYKNYVECAIENSAQDVLKKIRTMPVLGGEEFINFIAKKHLKEEQCVPEIPIHKVLLHPPTPLQIQIEIAKFYSIKLESLRHKNIEKKSVHRGLAMYLCVKYSDKKLCEICHEFDVSSGSAVSHAYIKTKCLLERDEQLREECNDLEKIIDSRFKT